MRVPIQEQPLQVLRLLLEAEGNVVTREHLRTALWPANTFVDFEHGVNTAVKKLRQALEDSAENPQFVETLPRLGYRFMVPVEWVADASGRGSLPHVVPIAPPGANLVAQPVAAKRNRKLMLAIAIAVMAVTAFAVLLFNQDSRLSHTRLGSWLRRPPTACRNQDPNRVWDRRLS